MILNIYKYDIDIFTKYIYYYNFNLIDNLADTTNYCIIMKENYNIESKMFKNIHLDDINLFDNNKIDKEYNKNILILSKKIINIFSLANKSFQEILDIVIKEKYNILYGFNFDIINMIEFKSMDNDIDKKTLEIYYSVLKTNYNAFINNITKVNIDIYNIFLKYILINPLCIIYNLKNYEEYLYLEKLSKDIKTFRYFVIVEINSIIYKILQKKKINLNCLLVKKFKPLNRYYIIEKINHFENIIFFNTLNIDSINIDKSIEENIIYTDKYIIFKKKNV